MAFFHGCQPETRHAEGIVINVQHGIADQEALVSLRDAAAAFSKSRPGRSIHYVTVHRWATRGVRGVRLETTWIGGRRFTSLQAVQRFIDHRNQRDGQPPRPGILEERKQELARKNSALEEAGF